jgi:hypothetical protein
MPGPEDGVTSAGTPRRTDSQPPSSAALELSPSASTRTAVMSSCGWSRAAASSERHGVMRAHAKSVSPGRYPAASRFSAPSGSAPPAESVTRRWAIAPSASSPGLAGAVPGHHVTTGVSGTSRGSTTESAWSASWP